MTSIDRVLSDFVDAWSAGRRPSVADALAQVPAAERDELAARLSDWLAVAPAPRYDDATRERIRASPALVAARAAADGQAGVLPQLLPRWRTQARLQIGDLAARVTGAFGLTGQEERAADYLERLERGELDGERLSTRLLDALAGALGVPARAIVEAGRRPAVAGGTLFRAQDGEWFEAEAVALSMAALTPAPPPMDELDRLFLGGPEG